MSQTGKIRNIKGHKMKIEIDVEQFARDIKAGESIAGTNGALGSLIKQLTEAALAAEIDSHLVQNLSSNKNGYSSKTMKSDHGTFVPPRVFSSFGQDNLMFQETEMVTLNQKL
ncbi:MAG: hypothetical protein RBS32_07620 [Aliarcobacter sp.]|nr:hypothetical protein [Aliarcobacter sp.]